MNLIDEIFGEGSFEFLQDHPTAIAVLHGTLRGMMKRSATTGDDPKQMKKLCGYCQGFDGKQSLVVRKK